MRVCLFQVDTFSNMVCFLSMWFRKTFLRKIFGLQFPIFAQGSVLLPDNKHQGRLKAEAQSCQPLLQCSSEGPVIRMPCLHYVLLHLEFLLQKFIPFTSQLLKKLPVMHIHSCDSKFVCVFVSLFNFARSSTILVIFKTNFWFLMCPVSDDILYVLLIFHPTFIT